MITMTRYAFVDDTSGEINGIIDTPDPDAYIPGTTQIDGLLVVPIPTDVSPVVAVTNWYYVNTGDIETGYFAERPEQPASYYYWEAAEWVLNSAELWEEFRVLRNSYLKQSDWTQMLDAPLTEAKVIEWQNYRQVLRDMPENNSGITHLNDVTWPTPPST